ncbi:MAG TPA: acetylglutamate kinase [Candidatus Limnocylindria bacterium]|nr:acetylglutamate kinase [Candidatus Limnocylindria bacterium]
MTDRAPLTVKLGGVAGAHRSSLEAIATLADGSCVVVHGGGRQLADWQLRLGLQPRADDGLRVTDDATLEVAVAVLAGLVNASLVAAFAAAGRSAVGLTGADAGLLRLERADPRLGRVGHAVGADPALLDVLTGAGLLPVVASIGVGPHAELLNVNADEVAGAIAAARGGRLLLCSDVPGVARDGETLAELSADEAASMLADGTASAGMVPKLKAAVSAASAGCEVRIIDGRSPEAVAAALAGEPVGTRVAAGAAAGGRR